MEHADWLRFDRQLGTQVLPFIDQRFGELRYRLPAPGAIVHDGVVEANYAWPGVTLHYTRDGSAPDATSPVFEGKVPAGGVLRIVAVTSAGRSSPEARIDPGSAAPGDSR
jgi:hexosaminidase